MGNGILSGVNLDLPNNKQPQDVQDVTERNNVKELSDKMKKTGINVLFPPIQVTTQTVITTTLTDLPGMYSAFIVSGGYVEIEALVAVDIAAAGRGLLGTLLIDGAVVDTLNFFCGVGVPTDRFSLRYEGFLPVGSHTVKVQGVAVNNNVNFTPANCNSWLRGKETLL